MFLVALAVTLSPGHAAKTEPLFPGLGSYRRHISTKSPTAERYFNQGFAFMNGFNHDEAIRSFQQAARLDPKCGMAWWGIALASGPNYNNLDVDPEHVALAADALKHAASASVSPVERALLDAMKVRMPSPAPADRKPLNVAYSRKMAELWRRFPKDPDVGCLYSQSVMELRPWDLWKTDGSPQPGTMDAVRALRSVLSFAPNHPMANHLYIHVMEGSGEPGAALDSADRLFSLQPGLGHMVHMPSHIHVRTGRWQQAIDSNVAAIVADRNYRKGRPRQRGYAMYMSHNRHMLAYAAMMIGQSGQAIRQMDDMVAIIPAEFRTAMAGVVDGYLAMPLEVRVRFGKWDAILAAPEPEATFPVARAMRHCTRGIAFAATGRPDEAAMEQSLADLEAARVPAAAIFGQNSARAVLAVAQRHLAGEIKARHGDVPGAVADLRAAVRLEDALRYDEPPEWVIPIRHTLGAVLLKAGRHAEAARVYREDLGRLPNNGWSLYGLAQAERNLGHSAESARLMADFRRVWAKADMMISSSCLCIPGR